MATGMVTINSWQFYPDGPLGCTVGYNGAHGTDIHLFQEMIACGAVRVRLNIKPDLYAATSMSTSPSTWNWGFVDAIVLMANQNNIHVTLIARGFTPSNNTTFASWQESTSCAPGYTQTTIAGYTKIAVALARRYSGDGNPDNAKDSTGRALQADGIELGNEEINSMQDSSSLPYTGCRKAMRYVKLVRDVTTQLRASSASGGGGWVPRGTFPARVGAWGIVHDQPNEIASTYGILTHPVLDATYNPTANSSSIFGFDSKLGVQLLDYANFHNYNPADGSGGLTPAAETQQIRGILNNVGNTNIPIWCTEAGWDGPCNNVSETVQATYYAANTDGSGSGALQALKDAGCQHWDIFTINYWGGSLNSNYIGQAMSIATKTSATGSPPNTYVHFQAHTRIAGFMTNVDRGAWAAQAVPRGFGGVSPPPPPPPPPAASSLLWITYFYPTDPSGSGTYWTEVRGTSPLTPRVFIFNKNNGPGTAPDSNFATAISQAHANGQWVIGYVNTSNFTSVISLAQVEANIDTWYSFYAIDGIMLDTVLPTSGNFAYYQTIYTYIKNKTVGPCFVVQNPAQFPPENYLSTPVVDTVITYEGEYANFVANYASSAPSWVSKYAPTRFSVIVGTVPDQASIQNVVAIGTRVGIGRYYIASLASQSSYAVMPSQPFFNEVVTAVYGSGPPPPPQVKYPLPGQAFVNGVSTYLFGTNLAQDFATNTVRNTPAIQAQIKQANFQLMRCNIPANSANSYTDSVIAACAACGCIPLVILSSQTVNAAWNQTLVTYLGNKCNLYEFGNEPDLGGVSVSTYTANWNTQIPIYRGINPTAAFIGPGLGVFANLNSYIVPWLTSAVAAGNTPDGVSYHVYPCTDPACDQTCCTPKSGNFQRDAATVRTAIGGVTSTKLAICLTEWNIDASNPPKSYSYQDPFNTTWTKAAIDSMVAGSLDMACQWDAGSNAGGGHDDLISTQFPYPAQVQYAPMTDRITFYLGGSPPPPPPPPPGGSLVGSFAPLGSSTINLTTEAAQGDWAHWGLTTGTTYDHKSTGGSQISDEVTLGNGVATQNPSAVAGFTWGDGTPDPSATNTQTGTKILPPAITTG